MLPALLLALLQPPAPEAPDAAALTRSAIENIRATVEVLDGVKDRASAERAKPRLEELHAQYEKLRKQFKTRPEAERLAAELKAANERKKQDEALTLAHDRVFARHKDAYKVLADTGLFKRVEGALEDQANRQAQAIRAACTVYYTVTMGQWPANLGALVVPSQVGPPLLEGGAKAIRDPWGAPFRLELKHDPAGNERPYIWTLSPYGDGKKKIVWPRDEKK